MADVTVVIAAESHQRVRALLDGEAGIVVAGEARSLAHAFVLVARIRPAVLLLDFGRGRRDALAALRAIRSQSSRTRIIVLDSRSHEAGRGRVSGRGGCRRLPRQSGASGPRRRGVGPPSAGRADLAPTDPRSWPGAARPALPEPGVHSIRTKVQ